MSEMLPPIPPQRRGMPFSFYMLLLVCALMILPYMLEQVQFALVRGRERAQAEVARGQLNDMPETQSVFRTVAKAVEPSVVGIVTTQAIRGRRPGDPLRIFEDGGVPVNSLGSGVIVDADNGYIITNAHVIDGAAQIVVQTSDGRTIRNVQVVGSDPLVDIAVLKIKESKLIAAPWGDSDKLAVGDSVLAVGNPYGLAGTVTAGIISAKERRGMPVQTAYQDFLQTDAAVNPGNSGGPLVNVRGEVVGINTAIVGEAYRGISFAIPSNLAKKVYEKCKTDGRVVRGWLGVTLQAIDEPLAQRLDLKDAEGALVTGVVPGAPAQAAGIEPGDVIVGIAGKPVRVLSDLFAVVAELPIGKEVNVDLIRDGRRIKVSLKVEERPSESRR